MQFNPVIRRRRWLCWIPAAVISALMIVLSLCCLSARYAVNDDAAAMRALMGGDGGTPASFLPQIADLITLPLSLLSARFPGVPFFSYLQIFFLWLGFTVIDKSLLQKILPLQGVSFHVKTGAVFAASVCAVVLQLYVCARITFTTTSAVLLGAAMAQLLSLDSENHAPGTIIRAFVFSFALLLCSWALRPEILPAALCFYALTCLFVLLGLYGPKSKERRTAFVCALCVLALLCGCAGLRRLRENADDVRDYMTWYNLRVAVTDYHTLDDLPAELLSEIGWDENVLRLVKESCFLPSEITADAFRKILAYYDSLPFSFSVNNAVSALASAALCVLGLGENFTGATAWPVRFMPVLAVLSLLLTLLTHNRRKYLLLWLAGFLGGLALVWYLCFIGRAPFRALYSVSLSMSVLFLFIIFDTAARLQAPLPSLLLLPLTVCAAFSASALFSLLPVDEAAVLEVGEPAEYLDEYAADNPDCLILYDYTLAGTDSRLFPKTFDGTLPGNVSFWGGWRMMSPENTAQLASFDISLPDRNLDDLLGDDVLYATGVCDPLLGTLTDYLNSRLEESVEPVIVSEDGGIYYVQFW